MQYQKLYAPFYRKTDHTQIPNNSSAKKYTVCVCDSSKGVQLEIDPVGAPGLPRTCWTLPATGKGFKR